jgi:Flp pilus assembly protein TadD
MSVRQGKSMSARGNFVPTDSARTPRYMRSARLLAAILVLAVLTACGSSGHKSAATSSSNPASKAAALLEQGLAAQSHGQLDVAKAAYLQVVQLDPTNKYAHYDLGVIYQQLSALDDAATEYNKALAIDTSYKPAIFNLAVLETTRNPNHAVELYRRLLVLNPKDANVHLNLGLLLVQIGKKSEGAAEISTALKLNPALASRVPGKSPTPSPKPTPAPSTTS